MQVFCSNEVVGVFDFRMSVVIGTVLVVVVVGDASLLSKLSLPDHHVDSGGQVIAG